MKRIRISWEWMIVLASSIVMIYILLIKPVIGVADNGDFLRLMSSVGLGNANPNATFEELYFRFIHTQFDYGRLMGSILLSIPCLLSLLCRQPDCFTLLILISVIWGPPMPFCLRSPCI